MESKDWYQKDSRRDINDKRLWRTFNVHLRDGKYIDETVLNEWKLSRFLVTEQNLLDGYEVYRTGGDITHYNPKLLFFIQKIAERKKDFECIKAIGKIAKERRINAEFDEYGDWKKTDELLT